LTSAKVVVRMESAVRTRTIVVGSEVVVVKMQEKRRGCREEKKEKGT